MILGVGRDLRKLGRKAGLGFFKLNKQKKKQKEKIVKCHHTTALDKKCYRTI